MCMKLNEETPVRTPERARSPSIGQGVGLLFIGLVFVLVTWKSPKGASGIWAESERRTKKDFARRARDGQLEVSALCRAGQPRAELGLEEGRGENVDCPPGQGAKLDQRWWSPRKNRAKCLSQPQSRSRRSISPAPVTTPQCLDRGSVPGPPSLPKQGSLPRRRGSQGGQGRLRPCISDRARRLPGCGGHTRKNSAIEETAR